MKIERNPKKEIPVLHGKDLVEQEKEPSFIKKLFLCVGQGLATGKWEWNITIKF